MGNSKTSDALISILIVTHVCSWVFFTPIFQLQMALFGKRIFTFTHFGIIEMVVLTFLIVNRHGKIKRTAAGKKSMTIAAFFLVSWFINVLTNPSLSIYNAIFYLMSWVFPFLVVFVISQYNFSKKCLEAILRFMLIMCLIHSLLIIVQHFSNSVIWPYSDYGEGKQIFFTGDNYYTMARCPGVTISGLDAGILLIFGIVVSIILKMKNCIRIAIISLFSIAIFYTGTRNVYVVLLYILGVTIVIKKIGNLKYQRSALVLLTIASSILYTCLVTGVKVFTSTGNIFTDNMSIMYRLNAWEKAVNLINNLPVISKCFGVNDWQQVGGPLMDNLYLETAYCAGVFSVFGMVWYITAIAGTCVKLRKTASIISAAFILSFLIYGVMNSMSNFYFTLIIILVVYWHEWSTEKILGENPQ